MTALFPERVVTGANIFRGDRMGWTPVPGFSPAPRSVSKAMLISMMSIVSRSLRSVGVAGALLLVCALGLPQNASGQLWLQTARVITPVEDGPTRAFLDTLVNVMERKERMVRRSPDQEGKIAISDLRNELISEAGIGLNSANHAFISYRFTIGTGGQFEQEISRIRFVYRPGPAQSDVSVMYLDAQEPWIETLIRQKGTSLQSNQAALIPFHRHLGFATVARQEKTKVVEIGGQTIREQYNERKQALIRKVERLTYTGYV